jgi:hypothetical protein
LWEKLPLGLRWAKGTFLFLVKEEIGFPSIFFSNSNLISAIDRGTSISDITLLLIGRGGTI